MKFYPPKVNARFRSPQNAGRAARANAVGTSASFECGSFVRISLEIENETKVIRDAKFHTNGCGYMIAAADTIAEALAGKQLTDLHGLGHDEYVGILTDELEEFPQARKQCADVVLNALKNALSDYRSHVLEEFGGDEALICTCFGVAEKTVEIYINANSPASLNEVTANCRAGGGCGSCRILIQELIDSRNFEGKS